MRARNHWGVACVLVALATSWAPAGARSERGLPVVRSGARPGPDVLYAPEPQVPQLQNRDPRFRAPFDRVSGTERYVGGEYLYTDHLLDDRGSDTTGNGGGFRAASAGKLEYPTDAARFGNNAADLVEFRIGRHHGGLAVRFTLNTLLARDTTIATAAFDADGDASTGGATLPRDPGAPFPGTDHVLTTWGTGAEWSTWRDGQWTTTPLPSAVDIEANQLTVDVPATVAAPAGSWRTTVAVGLYDAATGGWLRPARRATETTPGGAGPADETPAGIFNLGFRFEEQVLTRNAPPDEDQAAALLAHEPTRFAHPVDFDAMAARASRTTVPRSGTMVRFFPSRLALGEGRGSFSPGGRNVVRHDLELSRLQPYSLYVPEAAVDGRPAPFTLNLHSLNQHHWQYNGSAGVAAIAEERRSIVATPHARGPALWYQGAAEYDVFEMWNEVARTFHLDPDRTVITGYSMGGYGVYRLAGLYPDLFARALTVVAPPGPGIWVPGSAPTGGLGGVEAVSNFWLENARNVPFMSVSVMQDEFVPYVGPLQQHVGPGRDGMTSFDQLGYRFRFLTLPVGEHYTIGLMGYEVAEGRAFLADDRVERDPFHVTFAYLPRTDDAALGLVHDKAYWVSDLALADEEAGTPVPKGVIDVKSLAFGLDDPPSTRGASGGVDPLPYVEVNRAWGDPVPVARENRLVASLRNIRHATVDTDRAGLEVGKPIVVTVTSSHEAVVELAGPGNRRRPVAVAPGTHTYTVHPNGTVVGDVHSADRPADRDMATAAAGDGGRAGVGVAVGVGGIEVGGADPVAQGPGAGATHAGGAQRAALASRREPGDGSPVAACAAVLALAAVTVAFLAVRRRQEREPG